MNSIRITFKSTETVDGELVMSSNSLSFPEELLLTEFDDKVAASPAHLKKILSALTKMSSMLEDSSFTNIAMIVSKGDLSSLEGTEVKACTSSNKIRGFLDSVLDKVKLEMAVGGHERIATVKQDVARGKTPLAIGRKVAEKTHEENKGLGHGNHEKAMVDRTPAIQRMAAADAALDQGSTPVDNIYKKEEQDVIRNHKLNRAEIIIKESLRLEDSSSIQLAN